jgi:hypothetical protein
MFYMTAITLSRHVPVSNPRQGMDTAMGMLFFGDTLPGDRWYQCICNSISGLPHLLLWLAIAHALPLRF